MKNFNVYDPMKRGQGLVLDGQTLAHIEVGMPLYRGDVILIFTCNFRFCKTTKAQRKAHSFAC